MGFNFTKPAHQNWAEATNGEMVNPATSTLSRTTMLFNAVNKNKQIRNLVRDLVTIARETASPRKHAVVFCLDDVHHVDEQSWEILTALAKDKNALIVCTIRPDMERECC